jgi:hypothetical protein
MSVWTTPTTRSTGLLVTASIWNTDIVNNLIYLKTAPVFDTAVIIGAATTAGVRLDLESGTLAVREGDDSAYAPLITSVVNLPSGGSINFASGDVTITHSSNTLAINGAASGVFVNGLMEAASIRLEEATSFASNAVNALIAWSSGISGLTNGTLILQPRSSAATPILFVTGSTTGVERMRIPAAGGVQCVTTLSVGNATPAASGAGVTFPAAQSASSDANTLDDYQEASWTPTIVGSTTAGTGTYASGRFGRYTKIGNMITLWANLNWTGHTGTGNIEIGGLPENVVSLTDYRSAGVAITNDIALTAGNLAAVRAADAGTTLQLIQQPTGGGLWSNVPMDTNGGLTLTITYMTN